MLLAKSSPVLMTRPPPPPPPPLPRIIALSGKRGSGKDYAAEVLLRRFLPPGYRRVSFAAALKRMVAGALEVPDRYLEDKSNPVGYRWNVTVGGMLQSLGEAMRRADDEFWIRLLFKDHEPTRDLWVITDLRHLNEKAWIERLGGVCWRVERPGFTMPDSTDGRSSLHPSEVELDYVTGAGWDAVLINDGTSEGFTAVLENTLRRYGWHQL